MTEKKHGWAAQQSAMEVNFGGVDQFDYEHEQARDEMEMLPRKIRDDISSLLNSGRVEDAREIYHWLAAELNKRDRAVADARHEELRAAE